MEALERRQLLSVSSIQVQLQGQPTAGASYFGQVATFRDDAGSDSAPGDFAVSLTLSDGTSIPAYLSNDGHGSYAVYASEVFPPAGSYTLTAQLSETNPDGSTASLTGTAPLGVGDAPLQPLSPETLSLSAGQSFTGELGEFVDPAGSNDPTLFAPPIINFGDGTTGTGTLQPLGGGRYAVLGSYTYALPGSFGGNITVNENPPGGGDPSLGTSLTIGFIANVPASGDAPLDAGSPETISAVEGQNVTAEFGTFVDEAGPDSQLSDLSATIYFGDGNSALATLVPINGNSGSYSVQGSNNYLAAGTYTGSVLVDDAEGSGTSLTFTDGVADAPLDAGSPESISATQNQAFAGEVGVFVDQAGSSSTPTDLSATIYWGDGSSTSATLQPIGNTGSYTIRGSYTYNNSGTYSGSVLVVDQAGSTQGLSFSATVTASYSGSYSSDAPLDAGSPESISAAEGQGLTAEVGVFFDQAGPNSQASDLSAMIYFGDGNSSPATLQPINGNSGSYSILGSNTYIEEGSYAGSVAVNDVEGSSTSLSFTANVADASLTAGNAESLNIAPGSTYFGEVANFFDSAASASDPNDLSATINWGDGSAPSPALVIPIQSTPGSYAVCTVQNDSHTYFGTGVFSGSVDVIDQGGSTLTGVAGSSGPIFTAYVGDPALDAGTPENINATQGQAYTGEFGTFFDRAGTASNPSDLSATINFGDGNSSPATLVPLRDSSGNITGTYSVQGLNVYAQAGNFGGTVQVVDDQGSNASLSFSVDVATTTPQVWVSVDADGSEDGRQPAVFTVHWVGSDQGMQSTRTVLLTLGGSAAPSLNPTSSYPDGISIDGMDYTVEGAVPVQGALGLWEVQIPAGQLTAQVLARPLNESGAAVWKTVTLSIVSEAEATPSYSVGDLGVALAEIQPLKVAVAPAPPPDKDANVPTKAQVQTQVDNIANAQNGHDRVVAEKQLATWLIDYPSLESLYKSLLSGSQNLQVRTSLQDVINSANVTWAGPLNVVIGADGNLTVSLIAPASVQAGITTEVSVTSDDLTVCIPKGNSGAIVVVQPGSTDVGPVTITSRNAGTCNIILRLYQRDSNGAIIEGSQQERKLKVTVTAVPRS